MNEMAEAPDWLDENKVDEVLFCQEILIEHPMVCVRGTFSPLNGGSRMSVS